MSFTYSSVDLALDWILIVGQSSGKWRHVLVKQSGSCGLFDTIKTFSVIISGELLNVIFPYMFFKEKNLRKW